MESYTMVSRKPKMKIIEPHSKGWKPHSMDYTICRRIPRVQIWWKLEISKNVGHILGINSQALILNLKPIINHRNNIIIQKNAKRNTTHRRTLSILEPLLMSAVLVFGFGLRLPTLRYPFNQWGPTRSMEPSCFSGRKPSPQTKPTNQTRKRS